MDNTDLRVGCEFVQDAAHPTPVVMQIQPVTEGPVIVGVETWTTDPAVPVRGYTDMYGNRCLRLVLPAGRSTFQYHAEIVVPEGLEPVDESARAAPPADLPDEVLVYTLPSRYVLPDMLTPNDLARFLTLPPGYLQARAVVDWVHTHLDFQYGATHSGTTSQDVLTSRLGVCRDYTHLAIAFCRALDLPARYVFGYLPLTDDDPPGLEPDFAAWMEVWIGYRWWTFDPRNNTRRPGRVLVGRGRDASDVAMVTAFGAPVLESMRVWAEPVG